MRLVEFVKFLLEYKRDITQQKLGDKLVLAAQNDKKQNIDVILDVLEQIDPTKNKQYVEWLSRQYIQGLFRLEDYPRIRDLLTNFDKLKTRLPQKDINKFTLHSLEDTIDKILNVELATDTRDTSTGTFPVVPESKVLYNGPLGQLSIPETEKASCELGKGTKWCTAAKEKNMFKMYSGFGPLYIWRDKNGKKYQFHFDERQFMDSRDRQIPKDLFDYFREEHPVLSKLFTQEESQRVLDPYWSTRYAIDTLEARWPEAEEYIADEREQAEEYADEFFAGDWPEAGIDGW